MPSLHLMINFGDAYRVYPADHSQPDIACTESWSVGMWNTHHSMDWPPHMQILNVSFKPGGACLFLEPPLSELHNQIVPLDTLWGNWASEIRERLYHVPGPQARFDLLEQLLLTRLREAPFALNVVEYAVDQIARKHGALSIHALSDQIGISHKHLITQFMRLVGATPKEVARIYRFKHVLYSLDPTRPVEWMKIATQGHYYDQSHFNKDFETFTGHTPTDYLCLLRQLQVENPELAQYPQHLPTG